jgi:type II secretory pathway component PulC
MTDEIDTVSGYSILFNDDHFVLSNIDSQIVAKGLADGDILVEINHQPLSMKNVRDLFRQIKTSSIEESYTLKVRRGDENIEFTLNKITTPRVKKHIFSVDENASAAQLKLRRAWLQNL